MKKFFVGALASTLFLGSGFMTEVASERNSQSEKIMSFKNVGKFYSRLEGDWNGSYQLWLRPGTPAQESSVSARIRPVAAGLYYLMTYNWQQGGKEREGVFLFGGARRSASATWGDSFHMAPDPMICRGELAETGEKLILNGTYAAGSGPDWGWRTEFSLQSADVFLMEAYNITPDGQEALAVRAELHRESPAGDPSD